MLRLRQLSGGYGAAQVLFNLSLDVGDGEVVALTGRNGMGKTTTLRAIMGLLPRVSGEIAFRGRSLLGLQPNEIVAGGVGYVPEGRRIFSSLTVQENLLVARPGQHAKATWNLDKAFELFPSLEARRNNYGRVLSGGEQQMLAIGRALMSNPRLLVLDEATEGLAPLVREEIWRVLGRLKALGQAILIVDKNLVPLSALTDRHYLIARGVTVWCGSTHELITDDALQRRHLGV